MELAKYDLQPQEQLAVSLYLKSMNKAQSSRDAGYSTPSVFTKPSVKAAISEQLSIRAERLRLGGDWVLMELKRVYDRCMNEEFDPANALKALNLIGKHVDIRAFEVKDATSTINDDLVARLNLGRQRAALQQPVEQPSPVNEPDALVERLNAARNRLQQPELDEPPVVEQEAIDEEVSFLQPPVYSAAVFEAEADELLTPEQKMDRLVKHWLTKPSDRNN